MQSGSRVEGFQTVLVITDRKEGKNVIENDPLNDFRRSVGKRNGSALCSHKGEFARLQEGNHIRMLPERGDDI